MGTDPAVRNSYRCCQRMARQAASSFYWSFWLLPREKRRAMCALYAFSRRSDDLADQPGSVERRGEQLAQWRASVSRALAGEIDHPLLPALVDTVRRFEIPHHLLFDIIDGVQMDVASACRFASFDELQEYCYHVASAVGLACIHIWGYRSEKVFHPANCCGLAFQLTNILRDLKEDARRDRIYLPLDELARFELTPDLLAQGVIDQRFRHLMQFQIGRTEQLYTAALETEAYLSVEGRRIFRMMWRTYRELLSEIKRRDGDVFSERVRLNWRTRLKLALSPLVRPGTAIARTAS